MITLERNIKTAIDKNYQYLKQFDASILSAIESSVIDHARIKTIEAVTLFNWALLHLDKRPSETERETHVLVGDYLLSEFYQLITEDAQLAVLSDMMDISKQIHIDKSRLVASDTLLDVDALAQILYAPILYLVKVEFISPNIKEIIYAQVSKLMQDRPNLLLKEVI